MREFLKMSQGKITIPQSMRKNIGVKDGDYLMLMSAGRILKIVPIDLVLKEEYKGKGEAISTNEVKRKLAT